MKKLIATMAVLACVGTALADPSCPVNKFIAPKSLACVVLSNAAGTASLAINNDLANSIQVGAGACVNVYSYNYTGGTCKAGSTQTQYCMSSTTSFKVSLTVKVSKLPPDASTGISTNTITNICKNGSFSE